MDTTRRNALKTMLLGAGGLGLRGLLAGVPASLLAAAERAAAQSADTCDAAALPGLDPSVHPPQRLILITGAGGDPLNANVPGTYDVPGLYHATDAGFSESDHGHLTFGPRTWGCARPWEQLVTAYPEIGNRICFFHHGTYTVAHGDHAKVNAYMGAIRRGEMLCSFLAKHVHTCAPRPTTQAAPVLLSQNLIRYTGAVLPVLDRGGLSAILQQPTGTQGALRTLRTGDHRRLRDVLARTATPSQQAALAAYLQAQDDARAVNQTLVGGLANPAGANEQQRRNTVAVALLEMNLSPVVVMEYDFGGDNHSSMWEETTNTTQSVADLGDLFQKLRARGLQDDVTIVLQYVFGRTLGAQARSGNPSGLNGRDHNAGHHCTVIIGRGFTGSVIGGVVPTPGGDFRADSISSGSGAQGGDISYEAGLGSLAKTISAGMGLSRAVIEDQITVGKVVEGALIPALQA
jgi:hypothetical protein